MKPMFRFSVSAAVLLVSFIFIAQVKQHSSSNVVHVLEAVDLPTTLVDGKTYILQEAIIITAGNEITVPNDANIVITSSDRVNNTLTYSGTSGTLFSASAMTGSLTFYNINLFGNTNTTRLCNLVGSGFPSVGFDKVDVRNWGVISILDGFQGGITAGKFGWGGNSGGIFDISNSVFFGLENAFGQNFSDTNSDQFEIASDVDRVAITLTGFVAQPNERLININSSFTGEVIIGGVFGIPAGLMFNSAGLDESSIYVIAGNNSNQKDSKSIGGAIVSGNTTATTMASDTWTDLDLDGNAVALSNIEGWTLTSTTTAEVRYDDLSDFTGFAKAVLVSEPGSSKRFNFRVVKNGSVLPDDLIFSFGISGTVITIPILVPVTAETNDLFRIQIFQESGTDSPVISELSLVIE